MIKKILLLILFIFIVNVQAFCSETLNFNGFISDNANIISPQNEATLNQILIELQSKTKADVAIVTLNSLFDRPIEDVSLEIARGNKLGDKKLNNGALILIVPYDRKARIEIGYGLEGVINDAKAGRILDDYMIPYFKVGNYETGVIQGTMVLIYEIAEAYGVQLSFEKPVPPEKEDDTDILFIIIFIIILIIINGRGGPSNMIFFGPSRGFRGSGIKFGGGSGFGGGGASRGW